MPSLPRPPGPAPGRAYYLDLDGTLLALAAQPDAVIVPVGLPGLLARLQSHASGAVAIVTGRPLSDVDRLLGPLRFAATGQHGLERRRADGTTIPEAPPAPLLGLVRQAFSTFAAGNDGLIVEDKGLTIALHFRMAPERAGEALALAHDLAPRVAGELELLSGKSVVEFRPPACDKGRAIAAFQAEPPFAGRVPVFIGDDVTDEDGFKTVNEAGGIAIRVGSDGPTIARYVLPDIPSVYAWLSRQADAASQGTPVGGCRFAGCDE